MEDTHATKHRGESGSGSERPTLVVVLGETVTRVPLVRGVAMVLGRTEPSDVVLEDPSLSRRHVSIVWKDNEVWVEDLGSTNGTLIDGVRITRVRLGAADRITLGDAVAFVTSAPGHQNAGFQDPDQIEGWLIDAVERGVPVRLVCVRNLEGTHVQLGGGLREQVRSMLSEGDRATMYGPGRVLLALTGPRANSPELSLDRWAKGAQIGTVEHPGGTVARRQAFEIVQRLLDTVFQRSKPAPAGSTDPTLVAESASMLQLLSQTERVAEGRSAVLVLGESGVGKERIAHLIHSKSERSEHPFIAVNCGAITETLLQSAFFGHERGAFTGAEGAAVGFFEQAHGGTLFLDEIAELSAQAQAALLRVLDQGTLRRVGGVQEVSVDCRVISATHRDLPDLVENGRFRRDLWFRLNTITLEVPPLRQRPEDILRLAERFLRENRKAGDTRAKALSPDAQAALLRCEWPGNVRQLRNAIDRAGTFCGGEVVSVDDLPEQVRGGETAEFFTLGPSTLKERLRSLEANLIRDALRRHNGKQADAAKELGMPARTLSHRIRALGIDPES